MVTFSVVGSTRLISSAAGTIDSNGDGTNNHHGRESGGFCEVARRDLSARRIRDLIEAGLN